MRVIKCATSILTHVTSNKISGLLISLIVSYIVFNLHTRVTKCATSIVTHNIQAKHD